MTLKIFKDKRANAWINVMVILVLATCLAAGYTFLTSSNEIEVKISGVSILNDIHMEENEFNFYVTEAGEKAIEETYTGIASDEIPTADDFFVNFQKQFEVYNLSKDYLKKENFQKDDIKKVLKVKIDNWQVRKKFQTEENDLEVLHRKDLNFEFKIQN